jgi:hypothetical protein
MLSLVRADASCAASEIRSTTTLQAALRAVLGDHVLQRGSNITRKRLRFDFSHGGKLESRASTENVAGCRSPPGEAEPFRSVIIADRWHQPPAQW